MKLTKKQGERINPDEGAHVARLSRVIDIGTVYSEKYNNSERYVDLTWTLTATKHIFNEEKGEQPFVVSRKYTQKIGPKAGLGKLLKSWLGTAPEDDYDIRELFTVPCIVNVVHNDVTKDNETITYANVESVSGVPKGTKVPKLQVDPVFFDLDDFDQGIYEELPEFMRELIFHSVEYKEIHAPKPTKSKKSKNSKKKGKKDKKGKKQKADFLK